MELCGIPDLISDHFEVWLFRWTLWNLPYKNKSISQKYFPHIPMCLSAYKLPSCQTLSNAMSKSRTTPLTSNYRFASNSLGMSWVIEVSWCTIELPGLNPEGLLLRRLLFFK